MSETEEYVHAHPRKTNVKLTPLDYGKAKEIQQTPTDKFRHRFSLLLQTNLLWHCQRE
jgi:hypothetical protein